ncbi:amidohydrolase family protein [Microlunatus soli]|uniref:L-fuconolactonase n=1 Tax=Microlunatus soli TaxID=630515 RepID=A0A1H1ZRI2_9ACTN|nr:amidohydrolase family protein [Microlunatus soli]SDT36253.1 L-fuconolactonase [Microlunatus soli]
MMQRAEPVIIDAHQHIWDRSRSPYAWLAAEAMEPIRRDITLADGLQHLDRAGIAGTILVQADDTPEDTRLMLEAAADPRVLGVVGWLPLDRPDEARSLLQTFDRSVLVGIRSLIHDLPDPDWLLRPEVDAGLSLLERSGLPLDVPAVLPRHLENIATLADRHPELRFVIDHLGKPPIGLDDSEPWRRLLAAVAERPNVWAKLSGLYAAGDDPAAWTPTDLQPFVDHAVAVFGTERLMYGGDWPVAIVAGDYERVWAGLTACLADLSDDERQAILGDNAIRCYRLDEDRVRAVRPAARP